MFLQRFRQKLKKAFCFFLQFNDKLQFLQFKIKLINLILLRTFIVEGQPYFIPTNTPRVFHLETTWNGCFHVFSTWNTYCVFVMFQVRVNSNCASQLTRSPYDQGTLIITSFMFSLHVQSYVYVYITSTTNAIKWKSAF